MAYRVKAYMLREESAESGTRYSISFKDGREGITSWKYQNSSLWSFGKWNSISITNSLIILLFLCLRYFLYVL